MRVDHRTSVNTTNVVGPITVPAGTRRGSASVNIVAVYRKFVTRGRAPKRARIGGSLTALAVVLVALTSLAAPVAAGSGVPFNGNLNGAETTTGSFPIVSVHGNVTGDVSSEEEEEREPLEGGQDAFEEADLIQHAEAKALLTEFAVEFFGETKIRENMGLLSAALSLGDPDAGSAAAAE